ncbi:transcriptional regulator [Streptomyces sp. NPDC051940]|uniref:transcriptional regulator n=1 Tax=Streptomyces sp. NPDC051940 TaxID=3155675 RepID=UPI003446E653
MYDLETRKHALALVAQGRSLNAVSKQTGISRWCLRSWQKRITPLPRLVSEPCPICAPDHRELAEAPYSYLLGLYLGDGCISQAPRGTGTYLRIACTKSWPGLIDECRRAITAVCPDRTSYIVERPGDVMVTSYGHHWTCLFPQHGPGRKHERRIELAPWQRKIVDAHPWAFIRGLVHSDGCRITNWATRTVAGVRKRYEYPRYFFTNTSDDIIRLFTDALDRVGVEWKPANQRRDAQNVSVAKRASVALMDAHVGPKY